LSQTGMQPVRTTAGSSTPVVRQTPSGGLPGGLPAEPGSPTQSSAAFQLPPCYADAYSLVQQFFGIPPERNVAGARDVVRLANDNGARLDFLVATVPDPIDSSSGWHYDLAVDSIQRALEANNYVQDRFSLPWKCLSDRENAQAAVATASSSALTSIGPLQHEPRLGIVLFRRSSPRKPETGSSPLGPGDDCLRPGGPAEDSSPTLCTRLLVLFLVGETPTLGIDKEALATALDTMDSCPEWDKQVKLLGPFASGASASLWLAVKNWYEKIQHRGDLAQASPQVADADGSSPDNQQIHFRIISGSATNYENKSTLEQPIDGHSLIDFHATVLPDNTMLAKFKDYLHHLDPKAKVALLAETNSGYSGEFQRKLKVTAGNNGREDSPHSTAPKEASAQDLSSDNWLVLPFPMYISQLRSAYEKTRQPPEQTDAANPIPNAARPTLSVPLAGTEASTDLPPSFTPGTTTGVVDLDLQRLLSTISREGRNYVGLLATDTRDKLFLAEQIKKYCPDVRLFTFESDLLYAHPDFNSYTTGMIVVSSYPLFNENQTWTSSGQSGFSRDRRLQFPMQTAEGVYNASLALLDYGPDGARHGREPVEYRSPFSQSNVDGLSTPPVWITVVGRGDSLPLQTFADTLPSANPADDYVFAVKESSSDAEDGELFERARFGLHSILFWLLSLVVLANCLAFWKASEAAPKFERMVYSLANLIETRLVAPIRRPLSSEEPQQNSKPGIETAVEAKATAPPIRRMFSSPSNHKRKYGLWVFSYFLMVSSLYLVIASVILLPNILSLADGDFPGSAFYTVLPVELILFALIGTTLAALVRVIEPWIHARDDRARSENRASVFHLADGWVLILLSAAATAFVALISWRIDSLILNHSSDWIALYYRSINLGYGVSPLTPLTLLGLGLCIGCLLKLHRLRAANHSELQFPLTGKGGLHDAGIDSLARRIEVMLESPLSALSKLAVLIIVIVLFAIPFRIAWLRFMPSFDGPAFDWTVKIALGLLYLGLVLGFIQALSLWRQFRRLLQRLALHPIAEAFDRLPSNSSRSIGQFWGRLPRIEQLQRPAQELVVLLKRYPDIIQQLHDQSKDYKTGEAEKIITDKFAEALKAEASEPSLHNWFRGASKNGGTQSPNPSEPDS
ncbi:MAG TPA: hypothetical protein VEZ90_13790, partial [Blastocatellia bacterium]|nr:hypothetical protein [Blastocatellia bacterium]